MWVGSRAQPLGQACVCWRGSKQSVEINGARRLLHNGHSLQDEERDSGTETLQHSSLFYTPHCPAPVRCSQEAHLSLPSVYQEALEERHR